MNEQNGKSHNMLLLFTAERIELDMNQYEFELFTLCIVV